MAKDSRLWAALDILKYFRNVSLTGTEQTDSLSRIAYQLFLQATAAVPVTNSMADRIIQSAGFKGYATTIPVVRPAAAVPLTLTPPNGTYGNSGYSELVAASSITTDFAVFVFIGPSGAQSEDKEIDIGVGAGGSEVVKGTFKNWMKYVTEFSNILATPLGIKVAANSRVALRVRGNGTVAIQAWGVCYPLPL